MATLSHMGQGFARCEGHGGVPVQLGNVGYPLPILPRRGGVIWQVVWRAWNYCAYVKSFSNESSTAEPSAALTAYGFTSSCV